MGSFPASITHVAPIHGIVTLPRHEVTVFNQLAASQVAGRLLGFGDFTVSGFAVDPPSITVYGSSANVRYATTADWLVSRAPKLDRNNGIFPLCQTLIQHPGYSGPQFSAPDAWVNDRAQGLPTAGNAETWRFNWVLRHIIVTARNLASPPAP
jgi:hypothetical protein